MDYEKKYKNALEWARKVMQGKVGFVLDEVLEKFPELKESEDERIRKELIAKVKEQIDCIPAPDCRDKEDEKALKQLNKWLAWLEKQGEKKSIDYLTQQEAMDIAVAKCFEQGEQKPVFEMKTPEESLGIDSNTYNKIVDDCVYGEQKPAWSEEDERCLTNAIYACKQMSDEDYDCSQGYIDAINFLKSLKDRYTWKPSDEQIKAIKWISDGDNPENWSITLKNFYQDLKKLK